MTVPFFSKVRVQETIVADFLELRQKKDQMSKNPLVNRKPSVRIRDRKLQGGGEGLSLHLILILVKKTLLERKEKKRKSLSSASEK
jgi:hypothetical protein